MSIENKTLLHVLLIWLIVIVIALFINDIENERYQAKQELKEYICQMEVERKHLPIERAYCITEDDIMELASTKYKDDVTVKRLMERIR